MLTLASPSHRPPSGYAIIASDAFPLKYAAWYLYDCIEKLKQSKWFTEHQQYGVTSLDFRGYSRTFTMFGNDTIHLLLPDSAVNMGGFGSQWAAYHSSDELGFIYAICPYFPLPDFTEYVTHELSEALLDSPPGNGWYDQSNGEEDADLCMNPLKIAGYNVSAFYSNRLGRCFQQGDL